MISTTTEKSKSNPFLNSTLRLKFTNQNRILRGALTLLELDEGLELEAGGGEVTEAEAAGEEEAGQPPEYDVGEQVPLER